MSNSTVNFTSSYSTNSTTQSFGPLDICLLSISLLVGLPTHFCIIWLIITGTESGVASAFFNLNLSVCEIGNCLFCFFDALTISFSRLKIVSNLLEGLSITGRPLFQCLISVECYLAVVHPVSFLKYKPLRYRVICCTAAWIITLGSCFISMLILMLHNTTAHTWFSVLQFLLFFFIQLFCLVAVLRALKQSGPGERKKEEESHIKRKAFYLILISTIAITFIYVPYIIIGFCFVLTQQLMKELYSFSYVCYVLAGFVQPVLYLHSTLEFCEFSPQNTVHPQRQDTHSSGE
ncbi:C-C chemokine receptor type 8-like [Cyprinus carpio]|uniref:C-C chemokine receptor type 8-like n=1 Tax=Cyprinus carpio TaxID=7962 RepID=A0A9Q9XL24_CYPCA|nr:C-C chemokine receptor type 8-like [Cyprinus carpio]